MIPVDVSEAHLGFIGDFLCLIGTHEALWHFGVMMVLLVVELVCLFGLSASSERVCFFFNINK